MEPEFRALDYPFVECLWTGVVPHLTYQERKKFIVVCKIFNFIGNEYAERMVQQNRYLKLYYNKMKLNDILTKLGSCSRDSQKSALIASYLTKCDRLIKHYSSAVSNHSYNDHHYSNLNVLLNLGADPNGLECVTEPTPLFFLMFKADRGNFDDLSKVCWTLIKNGTDPRIVNIKKKNAFDYAEVLHKNETLRKKIGELRKMIFVYIGISGLDQKPIPEIPLETIAKYKKNMEALGHPVNQ